MKTLRRLQDGIVAVEYAILLGTVGLATLAGCMALVGAMNAYFARIIAALNGGG